MLKGVDGRRYKKGKLPAMYLKKQQEIAKKQVPVWKSGKGSGRKGWRNFDTKWEEMLAMDMGELGIKFQAQKEYRFKNPKVLMYVDFWLPDLEVVVEVDGSQHSASKDRERDHRLMTEAGVIEVIRFTNSDVSKCRAINSLSRRFASTYSLANSLTMALKQ